MRVKYLRLWRGNREGAVKDIADGAANLMIRRNICESVGIAEPVTESSKGKTSGRKRRNSK